MQKIILSIIFLLAASVPCQAALTSAQLAASMGNVETYQIPLAVESNIYKAISANAMTSYNTNAFAYQSVRLSMPSAPTLELVSPLTRLAGTSGAKVLLRKGLGLLGPVATAVTIGIAVKDLYDASQADPVNYPLAHAAGVPVPGAPTPKFSITTVPGTDLVGKYTMSGGVWFRVVSASFSNNPDTGGWLTFSFNLTAPDFSHHVYNGTVVGWNNSTQMYHDFWVFAVDHIGVTPPDSDANFPPVSPVSAPAYEELVENPDGSIKSQYQPEIDKLIKDRLISGDALIYPPSTAIKTLSDATTIAAAPVATQTAVTTAQNNYNANPSPENKQILDTLLAQQAALLAQQVKEDALVPPPIPSNTYDASITPPDKKSIPVLLASFAAASPLVSMVRSFTVHTIAASCSMTVGNYHGHELDFDFCHWQAALSACGGVLIIITSGFSILVVMRGW